MGRGGRQSGMATAMLAATAALALSTQQAAVTATPECAAMDLVNYNVSDYIRWSGTSDRLYLENGACLTVGDIYEARGDKLGPIYPFDEESQTIARNVTGSWYLSSTLYVTQGSTLVVQGTEFGGDCDHLLLESSPDKFINLRAHGGDIWIEGTHVESWDLGSGGVDEDDRDGRSYISALSEVITDPTETCDGAAKNDMGEARLDILDSEINHLGWYDSESYGIAYKVRGFCKDLSNPEIFDEVNVRGDILRSHIHHLYFGHYSYGHEGGNFSYNEVHDNIGYGFDPHDDSDHLTIHNNHVYNNGWHGIIASKRCDHVSIQNNVVHNNGKNGLMLHRSSDYATVKNNTAYGNLDAGLALYESSNCEVVDNRFYYNKYGVRFSMGSSNNQVYQNKILINGVHEKYAIFMYRGGDIPGVHGSDGRPRYNHVYNNTLMSDDETVKMIESDDNIIEGNVMSGRVSRFRDSVNNLWKGNMVPGVYDYKMQSSSCFDPKSDMSAPEEFYDEDFSYKFEYGDGFFCGV
ncbi:unnamed protein product [Laminaria digitata]